MAISGRPAKNLNANDNAPKNQDSPRNPHDKKESVQPRRGGTRAARSSATPKTASTH